MLKNVVKHYEGTLKAHGPTAAGVDWNSEEGQERRIELLLSQRTLFQSVNDLGCGYGAMVKWIPEGYYTGYDVSKEMIAAALQKHPKVPFIIGGAESLHMADWTVASGIFNVKGDAKIGEWEDYVTATIGEMAKHSRIGIGFNMLSDLADKRRPDLYYGNVEHYVLLMLRNGWRTTVMQDVKHEFTLLVKL